MPASLRQLRYLVTVQNTGSISKAAREMNISQSSILAAIDAAEQDSGARIFARQKGRGAIATNAGERYLAAARRLLSAEQEFNNTIRQDLSARGPIRIGCFEPFGSIMLIEVLRKMRARLGAFECTLLETDQVSLKRALDRGEVDIAVIYDLGPDFSGTHEHIGHAPPHAMVHSSNPLAGRDDISIDELAREPLVLLNLPLTTTYLMTLFDYASRRPRVSFQSGHYETIIRAVSAGFGSTILNAWPIRPLPAEMETCRLRFRENLPAPNLVTVDLYGDQKPPMVLELIAELKSHMALSYHGSLAPGP